MYYYLYRMEVGKMATDAISYTQARQNLAETMDAVCENHAPIIITRQKAQSVVMMSLEDYNSIQETAYLLSSPANAAHLRNSLVNAHEGRTSQVDLESL